MNQDITAQTEKNNTQINFTDWEKTLDKTKTELEIPNHLFFEDDKLQLTKENYPDLKVLHANSCGLKEIELDLPNLEVLWINDNKLGYFDFTKLDNLRILVISNNHIRDLELIDLFCPKLETLWCFNNYLEKLNCSGMEKLEDLNCSDNSHSFFITDNNFFQFRSMNYLNLDGCDNLKYLDADLNDLEDLSFTYQLPKLEEISLKQNKEIQYIKSKEVGKNQIYHKDAIPNEKIIFNSPKLVRVDISNSNIVSYENLFKTEIMENNKIDEGSANRAEDAENEWERRACERRQRKEQTDYEQGKHVWAGQEHLDLSNRSYIQAITIDGQANYPQSLTSINLGGNCLEEVIIRNLPQLTRLIISHNNCKNLVIENCPQLKKHGIYQYKSGAGENTPGEGQIYQDETDNPFKQQEWEQKRTENINKLIE